MLSQADHPFLAPPIPWLRRVELVLPQQLRLGPGLEGLKAHASFQRLWALDGVYALMAFGSRGRGEAQPESDLDLAVILSQPQLSPEDKARWWATCRQAIGPLGVGVDLVVIGFADAERLSGSRWHVMGDVAREGQVLCCRGLP